MPHLTTYQRIRKFLPRNYRAIIANETNDTLSHIDKVLRDERPDTKGVLVVAYRLAAEGADRISSESKELDFLKNKIEKEVA